MVHLRAVHRGSGTLLPLPRGMFANKVARPSSLIRVPMDEHSSGLPLPSETALGDVAVG